MKPIRWLKVGDHGFEEVELEVGDEDPIIRVRIGADPMDYIEMTAAPGGIMLRAGRPVSVHPQAANSIHVGLQTRKRQHLEGES